MTAFEMDVAGHYCRLRRTLAQLPAPNAYYRALGFGLRDEFADVLNGTKTVEELLDYPTEEPRSGRRVKAVQLVEPQRSDENGNGSGDNGTTKSVLSQQSTEQDSSPALNGKNQSSLLHSLAVLQLYR